MQRGDGEGQGVRLLGVHRIADMERCEHTEERCALRAGLALGVRPSLGDGTGIAW